MDSKINFYLQYFILFFKIFLLLLLFSNILVPPLPTCIPKRKMLEVFPIGSPGVLPLLYKT